MQKYKRIHIISRGERWIVKTENSSCVLKIYTKKDSALKFAKKVAFKEQDIVVHKTDGSIQKWIFGAKY